MQFVKNHWISLICGLVAALAITAAVFGMMNDRVMQKLKEVKSIATPISSLRANPRNEEAIAAELARGQEFQNQYTRTLETAATINARKPLLEGVFPEIPPGQLQLAFKFQEQYRDSIYRLPKIIEAGGPPSPTDIQDEAERLAEEQRILEEQRKEEEGGGAVEPAPTAPRRSPMTRGMPFPPGAPGRGRVGGGRVGGGRIGGGPPGMPPGARSSAASAASVANQPEANRRAAIRKARNIRVYAEANPEHTSFHISPVWDAERAPTARDMWYAQVGLWVQEDAVNAVAALNEQVIQERGLKEDEIHVANMPVKQILGIQVHGYITKNDMLIPFEALTQTGSSANRMDVEALSQFRESFTGRTSDEHFDVIRFSMTVAVDQRYLLRFVDELIRQNFYQLVGLQYKAGPPGGQEGDYYYGDGPVVIATLDFEGYMARKVYLKLMPASVREELGIQDGKQ